MHPDPAPPGAGRLDPYHQSRYREWLGVALQAASAAGDYALQQRRETQVVETRTAHDVKLRLDRECQDRAERVIAELCPDHAILGEESTDHTIPGGDVWVIDPLDGTVNYFNRFPYWCSSVALMSEGQVVAGVVYAPMLDECFTATLDGPSCLNGRVIEVSRTSNLGDACVLTGMSAILQAPDDRLGRLAAMLTSTSKIRVLGASALDHCYVAAGRADGLMEYSLHLWDLAAGGLIVDRAGGTFERMYVQSDLVFGSLCSNGKLHAALRRVIVE